MKTSPVMVYAPWTPTCGDMIYSGHTMLFVLFALVWHTYYSENVFGFINYVKCAIWGYTIVSLLFIVGIHMHYTVDVALALYFTVTVWSSYHRIAEDVKFGRRCHVVQWFVDKYFIYPVVEWFERGFEQK